MLERFLAVYSLIPQAVSSNVIVIVVAPQNEVPAPMIDCLGYNHANRRILPIGSDIVTAAPRIQSSRISGFSIQIVQQVALNDAATATVDVVLEVILEIHGVTARVETYVIDKRVARCQSFMVTGTLLVPNSI